jgi:hypothetical protein
VLISSTNLSVTVSGQTLVEAINGIIYPEVSIKAVPGQYISILAADINPENINSTHRTIFVT